MLLGAALLSAVAWRAGWLRPPPFTGRAEFAGGVVAERVEPTPGLRLFVVRVPRRAGARLRALLLAEPGELGSLAARADALGALAAINGDYHHLEGSRRGLPQAWLVDQGRPLVEPEALSPGYEASFWLDPQGAPHVGPLAGVDDVALAIGSGPWLLSAGALAPGLEQVRLPGYVNRLARAAVGVGPDAVVFAVTPQTPRAGASHLDMARALLALGCRDAVALDGGPSATLWVRGDWRGGELVNVPLDAGAAEPPLASGLFVLAPGSGGVRLD